MTSAGAIHHPSVGMRELSQRTAKVLALVRDGETVEITDRGRIIARIVPAADGRYEQLIAAGLIRQAARGFEVTQLPVPTANLTEHTTGEWLAHLRGNH